MPDAKDIKMTKICTEFQGTHSLVKVDRLVNAASRRGHDTSCSWWEGNSLPEELRQEVFLEVPAFG